uniref:Transmembrane protein n=1 Tax=Steinernema glaseri TaxID=37863 RepID=A0A1I7ZU36_9BILA
MEDEDQLHPGLPAFVLGVLIFLMVVLAGVIWVAFCLAVHRTAQRVAQLKRERQRRTIITAAITQAAQRAPPVSVVASVPCVFPNTETVPAVNMDELPSYDEAIRMKVEELKHSHPRQPCPSGTLRIAPNRPSTSHSLPS